MNLTALAWLLFFASLSVASLRRPVYAAIASLMVFFASPAFWWFGGGFLTSLTMRWSLVAVFILFLANLATFNQRPQLSRLDQKFYLILFLISANAFIINALFANYPPESSKVFDILWKGCLTAALIHLSVRDREDLKLFMFAVVIGCGFVGYQVVINGQGSNEGGRLEGILFPGAQGANGTAAVLSMGLVLSGHFVITMQDRRLGLASLLCAPLILETLLRCNSRGSYLGLIVSGIFVITLSNGATRKQALVLCIIGATAILALANSASIWERFNSIFANAEDRDGSASERLLYWTAAFEMISDYPLGSGGEAAFTSPRGVSYIAHFRPEFRSVHNGPLDIAAGWGIQGFSLLATIIAIATNSARKCIKTYTDYGDSSEAFVGIILISTLLGQLTCCMFTSVLDGEWFLWLSACCIAYARFMDEDGDASDVEAFENNVFDDEFEEV